MSAPRSLVAILATLCGLAACYAPPIAVAPAGSCRDDAARAVAAALNDRRGERGLPALTIDARLVAAAARHSADMAAHEFLGHTGSDGSTHAQRIAAAGVAARLAGEVVAAGQPSPAAAVAAWMSSRRHRGILLLPDADRVGAACATSVRGALFWTAVVAAEPGR